MFSPEDSQSILAISNYDDEINPQQSSTEISQNYDTFQIGEAIKQILQTRRGQQEPPDSRYKHVFRRRKEKAKRIVWTKTLTEKFYEGLGKYGPNFTAIQRMLPEFTRRQLVLKYRYEMKYRPMLVNISVQLNLPESGGSQQE